MNIEEYNVDLLKERLDELFENAKTHGVSANKIAKEIQIGRSTVSKYIAGTSLPSIPILVNLARYFNVSTDYLLGLTDIPSPDVTERGICEATGLTMEAIENCKAIQKDSRTYIGIICGRSSFGKEYKNTLSKTIENAEFSEIIRLISEYVCSSIARDIRRKANIELAQYNKKRRGFRTESYSERCDMALYRVSKKIEVISESIIEEYSKINDKEMDNAVKYLVKCEIDEKKQGGKTENG